MFFSHNKSANGTFSHALSAKQTDGGQQSSLNDLWNQPIQPNESVPWNDPMSRILL
jgi:hypothetical protein